jgi:hypothetical protein
LRRGRSDTPVGGYRRERDRDSKVTRMALYYFEIYRDGNEAEIDRHGTDLPDLASVRSHVLGLLPRIVGGAVLQGHEHDFVCIVRDAESLTQKPTIARVAGCRIGWQRG